jgi:hypothetical protein
VRLLAAGNTATPPEALVALARDPDIDVRHRAAGNIATPPEALAVLARDPKNTCASWRRATLRYYLRTCAGEAADQVNMAAWHAADWPTSPSGPWKIRPAPSTALH